MCHSFTVVKAIFLLQQVWWGLEKGMKDMSSRVDKFEHLVDSSYADGVNR
jgi:hypothetical protein